MKIKDEITSRLKTVDSVSSYIENLRILQKEWCDDNWFMVYRGETEEYSTPCIPTIYRGFALKQKPSYEINMFMAMRQVDISESKDYLHNAIDAQHDGFPSRLLDVTYNSLIALYFAVTPYYYKEENSTDNKDGIVYVFKYKEAYSPEANNTKMIYENALGGKEFISNEHFLSYHHILIDHCKQNKRIIAQQGAFVLFTGESPIPIPYHQMCGIRISQKAKARIRNELRYMFGIYTGSVYPEVELMQEEIKARCLRFNTDNADLGRSTNAALEDLEEEYDYFADCCDYYISEGKTTEATGELVRIIEKTLVMHKTHLKEYWKRLVEEAAKNDDGDSSKKAIKPQAVLAKYNRLLEKLKRELPSEVNSIIGKEILEPLGGKDCGEEK